MRWLLLLLYPRLVMSALTDLQAAVAKLDTDLTAKLAAKDAQIADLQAQLAAAQSGTPDQALIDLTNQLVAIDVKVEA